MSRIHTRPTRPERVTGAPAQPRFVTRGGQLPSDRYGARWRSLPVEGSAAFERATKRSCLARLILSF